MATTLSFGEIVMIQQVVKQLQFGDESLWELLQAGAKLVIWLFKVSHNTKCLLTTRSYN